jgi:hypothetical protein
LIILEAPYDAGPGKSTGEQTNESRPRDDAELHDHRVTPDETQIDKLVREGGASGSSADSRREGSGQDRNQAEPPPLHSGQSRGQVDRRQ